MGRLMTRLSIGNWSLRARLLAGVVGLVSIALVTTGIIGTTLVRSYLVHQVDQQLNAGIAAASRAPVILRPPPDRDPESIADAVLVLRTGLGRCGAAASVAARWRRARRCRSCLR